jgi:hypothetical protein
MQQCSFSSSTMSMADVLDSMVKYSQLHRSRVLPTFLLNRWYPTRKIGSTRDRCNCKYLTTSLEPYTVHQDKYGNISPRKTVLLSFLGILFFVFCFLFFVFGVWEVTQFSFSTACSFVLSYFGSWMKKKEKEQ